MENFDNLLLQNQVCFPLYVCSREVINAYRPFLEKLDITYTQYITLMVLWEKRSVTVKELCRTLHLDSGTLTPLLKKLEAKGLVERVRSSVDERSVLANITEKGMNLREDAVKIPREMMKCVEGFSQEEAQRLRNLLDKLLCALWKAK